MSSDTNSDMSSDETGEVVALVMAAGIASRFGSDKRRARLEDGRTLLETTLETVSQSYPRCLLVTRPDDDPDLLPPCSTNAHQRLQATHAVHGLGGSLGDAFRHLLAKEDGAIAAAVVLADMPWLTSSTCTRLNQHAHAERIVMPCHQGRRGHPVVFGRSFWPALAELKSGEGARDVVRANRHAVEVIEIDDAGIWRDVDTPTDLADRV